MKISLLINKIMPTFAGILIFISQENFMLSSDEHEKSLGLGLGETPYKIAANGIIIFF